jgi:hypothetical protein
MLSHHYRSYRTVILVVAIIIKPYLCVMRFPSIARLSCLDVYIYATSYPPLHCPPLSPWGGHRVEF